MNEAWRRNRMAFKNGHCDVIKHKHDELRTENRISDNETWFYFKETDDWKDWKNNVRALHKLKNKDWDSHNGFTESAKLFTKDINDIIEFNKSDKICFSCYSRGGPLALHHAVELALKHQNKRVYCFFCCIPKLYSRQRAMEISQIPNLEIHFAYYKRDIVKDLPPDEMGYWHVYDYSYELKLKFADFGWLPFFGKGFAHLAILKHDNLQFKN